MNTNKIKKHEQDPSITETEGKLKVVTNEDLQGAEVMPEQDQNQAIDEDIPDSESKKTKPKKIIKAILAILVSTATIGAGYYLYTTNEQKLPNLINFTNNSDKNQSITAASQQEISRLSLQIDDITSQLNELNIKQTIESMKEEQEALKGKLERKVNDLQEEIELYSEKSSMRVAEILQLKDEVRAIKDSSSLNTQELALKIQKIENDQKQETKKLLDSIANKFSELDKSKIQIDAATKSTSAKSTPKSTSNKTETTDTAITEIKSVGNLRLVNITQFGSQFVAQLSDGLSGAMPIIKEDRLGNYTVKNIDNDGVVLKDYAGREYLMQIQR
ncbi:hypothetical protein [Vibrio sp. 1180_3]|uniref:hypothetical protein n=1 Tax=Vibrio sp. 1180_3 TaxID=2528832 RepID=UPI0024076FFB|nr:hypothetical protein [Vibrio sp. 1180_3]MDF9399106.1 hypothetical protein [Vibrio sp. 1180_3]